MEIRITDSGRKTMEIRITDSEWRLMECLWMKGPLTQAQLMKLLEAGWNKNTVHTFLSRLTKKGLVQTDKTVQPHEYQALVSREDCVRQEEQNFLDKLFQGSAGKLVTSFVKQGRLTEKEREDLKKLLEELDHD